MVASTIVLTPEHLAEVVDYFLGQDAFCFDVEAFGDMRGVPSRASLNWMSLATYGMAVAIPFGHPNGDRLLARATKKKNKLTGKFDMLPARYDDPPEQLLPSEVFSALKPLFFSDRTKIAHNATYDLISTAKYFGEAVPPPYSDTIVLQWLLDENLMQKGLKDLIKRYYKVDYDQEGVGKCVEAYPFSKVGRYAYLDAKYTWLLWRKLQAKIDREGLAGIARLEMDLIEVLVDMGLTGAPIDTEVLGELEKDLSVRLIDIEGSVYRTAGQRFNINAPAQKAKVLYSPKGDGGQGLKPKKLTKGGRSKKKLGMPLTFADYSTDVEALEFYPTNPVVKALAEYSDVNKLLSTYVRAYLGNEAERKPSLLYDGRLHADFVQYGTVSGRFSCREPNLQNIPRPSTELGKKIRGLFVPPAGQKLIVADYSAVEMVLLAHFAGRGALFEGLMNGVDPHTATAAAVFGVSVEEVTPAMRQVAKGINFAVVYGAQAEKVASMSNTSVSEAEGFLKRHEEMFPEIYRFKKAVIKACRSRRPPHIKTLMGRKRRLPTMFASARWERERAERQAVNSLIQGSAADLIKLAMVRLGRSLPEDMHLILTIHDELVVTCPEDRTELGESLVREAMLGEGIRSLVRVPLTSDVKTVDRWSAAK